MFTNVHQCFFLLNIVYFSVCLTSKKFYWIEDQLTDVFTRFYTSASWCRRVGVGELASASWRRRVDWLPSYIHSLGVQYLLQNPEQFIESNTDHSWQDYLSIMSCQGTWADAIIIQAVANCLNLSIHIAESFETFAPVTVVQAVNVTGEYTNIYIGHLIETHYVSTVEKRNCRVPNNKTCDQSIVEKKKIDKHEKRRADQSYMKEYMRKRRANADFRKRENQHSVQRYNNTETIREKKNQTVTKRKMTNPESVREIDKRSKRKRKAENPDHIKEIAKKSSRRQKVENSEQSEKLTESPSENIKKRIQNIEKKLINRVLGNGKQKIQNIEKKLINRVLGNGKQITQNIEKKLINRVLGNRRQKIQNMEKKVINRVLGNGKQITQNTVSK